MTTSEKAQKKPLWLLIEEKLLEVDPQDLSGGKQEGTIQRIAKELDAAGTNVSRHGGNLLELRWAAGEMVKAGKPLMKDLKAAVSALTLEDATDPHRGTDKVLGEVGMAWPKLRGPECRPDVVQMVRQARLDLLIAKAKEMEGDKGIRYLLEAEVAENVITGALEITDDKLKEVKAQIAAELAERERVAQLLQKMEGKPDDERIRHLIEKDVAEALIIEMAGVGQGAIDAVNKAMEEELAEKKRLAEEEAARKKAEAEGPSLDAIPADQMLEYIESIREIMEFSDQEKEIRVMCEQSAIPKALVDVAVSDPAKLDELEKQAEG